MSVQLYVDGEFGPGWKILRWGNPNRLGYVGLIEKDDHFIAFQEDPDGGECHECGSDSKNQATGWFEDMFAERLRTPNWEAQAEYDRIWGPPLEYPEW